MGPSTAWAGQPARCVNSCVPAALVCIPKQRGPTQQLRGHQRIAPNFAKGTAPRRLTAPLGAQIQPCPIKTTHPWEQCCYAHPHENARRRDPRKYRYIAEPCPDYKRGICLLVRPLGCVSSCSVTPGLVKHVSSYAATRGWEANQLCACDLSIS